MSPFVLRFMLFMYRNQLMRVRWKAMDKMINVYEIFADKIGLVCI